MVMRSGLWWLAFGLFAVVAIGVSLPMARWALEYLEPAFLALGSTLIAGIAAGVWLSFTRAPPPRREHLWRLSIVSLGMGIGFPLLSAWSMQTLRASDGGIVLGILPFLTAAAVALIGDERPSLGFWSSSAASAMLLIAYSIWAGIDLLQPGMAALALAAAGAALGYAAGGSLAKQAGGGAVVSWALVFSLPIAGPAAWLYMPSSLDPIPPGAWLGLLCLGLAVHWLANIMWLNAMAARGIARTSQIQLLQPFVTVGASAMLLAETIQPTIVALAFMLYCWAALGSGMSISQPGPGKPAVHGPLG